MFPIAFISVLIVFVLIATCTSKKLGSYTIRKYTTKTDNDDNSSPFRGLLKASNTLKLKGGFGGGGGVEYEGGNEEIKSVQISGSSVLDGIYLQAEDINGRLHFERFIDNDPKGPKIHLYWSGNQWILHHDLDPSRNFDNLLAYAKIRVADPLRTSSYWNVKSGKAYQAQPQFSITKPGAIIKEDKVTDISVENEELMGVPRQLFPLYVAFLLDAIAVGLAMPLLPFYVMELGANALQLSMVVSANYVAQMVGCLVMGQISDKYGRRVVLYMCLIASSISYFCVSKAHTLTGVALSRIIAGSCGGLVPVMQSCVADVSSQKERPKYLGRIMATFGMGFVLGPALSALMPGFSTREKIRMSGLLPLSGFLIAFLFFKETKKNVLEQQKNVPSNSNNSKKINLKSDKKSLPVESSVMLLVLNGFLIMYAFGTETIYAMFMKDSFGYGERALSTLFAFNGFFIGVFQVFFIKPMINLIGKHATLGVGNALLAAGMVGVALVRKETLHFMLFAGHIVGYSIADTALASLISRYSAPATQGRDLAFNQAAQSCARVLSPLFAGLLYERSKRSGSLPVGALPFLAGAAFPAVGIAIPALLYIRSVARKRAILEEEKAFENHSEAEDS
mmetsp:Transcript_13474/g.13038  ORF Transcript_13474/g.13038 Transcript_13474/m.13038 type:complete len:621 (+) Transcript_13474:176-2038(+)